MLGNVVQWTLDQYDPSYYAHSPASNPWNKATKPYPHVARGGSWDDDDVTKLRCAARRASDASWKIQDPQLPKSVWYHTDAQFLGFRIVRPLKTPTAEEAQAYWNSGVEKDNPALSKAE
jgi:formylglycine-generating enzyme required for sulfatase activity